jgi:hypothetical protein
MQRTKPGSPLSKDVGASSPLVDATSVIDALQPMAFNDRLTPRNAAEETKVTIPERSNWHFTQTLWERMRRGIIERFGSANRFSVTTDERIIEGCRKMTKDEADEGWLMKLANPSVVQGSSDRHRIVFPNAPGWSAKSVGGGLEKNVFLVVDDEKRVAAVELMELFKGKRSIGSVGFYEDLGKVETPVKVTHFEDGRTESSKKTMLVREYVEGATVNGLNVIDGPKSALSAAVNGILSFPYRLLSDILVGRVRDRMREENIFEATELHMENFLITLQDRPITEDGIGLVPMPQVKDGRLRIRWLGPVRTMDVPAR